MSTAPEATRSQYLDALLKIGPPEPADAELLLPLLRDAALPAGRHYALDALATMGAEARVALEALVSTLAGTDAALKRKAALVLGQIGPPARERALSGLLDMLRDGNEESCAAARHALEKLGPPDRGDAVLLRSVLTDPNPALRRFAVTSLGALGGEAKLHVLGLLALLKSEKVPELRREVLAALVKIDPKGRDVIEGCIKALEDPDAGVCRQAVAALVEAGAQDQALPGLLRALDHRDAEVVKAADEALTGAKIEKAQAAALGAALARASGILAQMRLLDLVEKLGPDAADAVPGLRVLLRKAQGEVQLKALQAVAAVGVGAREAGAELAPLLQDKDPKLKFEVALTLAGIEAEQATQAVPILVRGLRLSEMVDEASLEAAKAERYRIAQALIRLGRPAVPRLIHDLDGEFSFGTLATPKGLANADARLAVVQVLAQIGAKTKAPEILLALARLEGRDPIPDIKAAARQARNEIQHPKEGK
jgi:HEAT repeat protein